ncbi:bifunctional adenosylcobinamide kinase/adenosylcobinamide-phosphate guanylyltransferase [Streptomyces alkaliphilus]|uniref:bifunctional adenosylcobinamide kinase/adenosylcobinamide-phosphate guanylyltransferase n=1 Tax=Streptomyces alkaliphilus TaxID=1472722 RepID=UPI00117F4227|nr:adenosylcobinamide kinase/adenosylcobinamide phosphate guanyltransferase [Streptomyces alkaliphilus]
MDITLLGTGAPPGLPRPDCSCAACARALGPEARAATSVLVDGVLLLDLTPGAALAAARAGRTLHGVRQVVLAHPHDGPLPGFPEDLPPAVRLPAGEEVVLLTGHRVRAVAPDSPGTGYAVTGPDGQRLLYLPPGAGPAGGRTDPGPVDLCLVDVIKRPDAVARLRADGAIGPATDLVAVHLDHDVPPGPELRRRLAAAGARAVPDGAAFSTEGPVPTPLVPRRTLVLGGARSGKSLEAERRLATFPDVVYAATGGERAGDAEWRERVRTHRERRPVGWSTEETRDPVPLLRAEGPPLLVDCLSLWLTAVMDTAGAWEEDRWRNGAATEVRRRIGELAGAIRTTPRTVVAVSNEVGSGVVPATPAGRRFRDELGRLNAAVATECEQVLLVVAGTVLPLRG